MLVFLCITASHSCAQQDAPRGDSRSIGFSRSLTVEVDRDLQQAWTDLQSARNNQDWPQVGSLLRRLLEAQPGGYLTVGEAWISPSAAAVQVLGGLPEEALAAYRRLAEPPANESLSAALSSGDERELTSVASRFPRTASGERAVRMLAQLQQDQGRLTASNLTLRRLAVPGDSELLSSQVRAGLADANLSQLALWTVDAERPWRQLADIVTEVRDNGMSPWLQIDVIRAGNVLVVSSPLQRTAVDARTGEVLWRRITGTALAREFARAGPRSRELTSPQDVHARLAVTRETLGDSLFTSTSTDGERVYFVDAVDPVPLDADPTRTHPFPRTKLIAVDVRSGEPAWEQAEAAGSAVFWSGPPLHLEGKLYVIGEAEQSGVVSLFELEATTGRVASVTPIGQVVLPLGEDRWRQIMACPVFVHGPWLVCPNVAGAVVSVDPQLGQVRWIHRYSRTIGFRNNADPDRGPTFHEPEVWSNWTGPRVLAWRGQLVVAAPDHNEIMVIDPETGARVRTFPQDGGRWLAAAHDGLGIIVVGDASVWAWDPATGARRWRTELPASLGRGVVLGDHYHFPTGRAQFGSIDLRDGAMQLPVISDSPTRLPVAADSPLPPRHLDAIDGDLFESSLTRIRRIAIAPAAEGDSSPVPLADRAWRLIEAQQLSQAWQLLVDAMGDDVALATDAELALLVELASHRMSGRNPEFAAALTGQEFALLETAIKRLLPESAAGTMLWLRAQAVAERGDWRRFVELWLDADPTALSQTISPEPGSQVQLLRWFQATAEAAQTSNPDARAALTAAVDDYEQRWSIVAATRTALWQRLGSTHWGQRSRLRLGGLPPNELSRLRHQLALVALTASPEPAVAATALARLVDLYELRRAASPNPEWLHRNFEAVRQLRLAQLREFPSTQELLFSNAEPGSARSVGDFLAVADRRQVAPADWPSGKPATTLFPGFAEMPFSLPFHVQSPEPGLYSRLNVELKWPEQNQLWFSGGDWNASWRLRMPVARGVQLVRGAPARAWALDELLVTQLGLELAAVRPFGESGAREPEVLWPRDGEVIETLPRERIAPRIIEQFLPLRPGFSRPDFEWRNQFGQAAAAVGPVRCGFVCYQSQGALHALDPITGRLLWRRTVLTPGCRVIGDENRIAVLGESPGMVRIVSMHDGRTLQVRDWSHPVDDILIETGGDLILASGDPRKRRDWDAVDDAAAGTAPLQLSRISPWTGEEIWSREFPAGSIPFETNHQWLGVLRPGGAAEFVNLETGRIDVQHQLAVPAGVDKIACSVGRHDFLVCFSERLDDQLVLATPQYRRGPRIPLVNGPLYAFSLDGGGLLWSSRLENASFALDQPPDLPVFATSELRFEKPSVGADGAVQQPGIVPLSRIRVFDRRDGDLLYEIPAGSLLDVRYRLSGNREAGEVWLETTRERVRLKYTE